MPVREKIQIIQFLRFAAALAVVGVHTPTLEFGTWGVDLFFIISGFVICFATDANTDKFVRRRVIRIVPIYWAMTLALFAIALLAPGVLQATDANWEHLWKSLFFVPFDKNGTGHFPILFLGWTLNYEMMFYALFAIALAISTVWRALISGTLILGLIILARWVDGDYPLAAYEDWILMEFIFGMALYHGLMRPERWRENLAGLLLLLVLPLLWKPELISSRAWMIGGGAAAIFLVSVLLFRHARIPSLFLLLGNASYALYLSHPFVIQTFTTQTQWFEDEEDPAIWATIAVVSLTVLVSVMIWLAFEKPVTRWLTRRFVSAPTVN